MSSTPKPGTRAGRRAKPILHTERRTATPEEVGGSPLLFKLLEEGIPLAEAQRRASEVATRHDAKVEQAFMDAIIPENVGAYLAARGWKDTGLGFWTKVIDGKERVLSFEDGRNWDAAAWAGLEYWRNAQRLHLWFKEAASANRTQMMTAFWVGAAYAEWIALDHKGRAGAPVWGAGQTITDQRNLALLKVEKSWEALPAKERRGKDIFDLIPAGLRPKAKRAGEGPSQKTKDNALTAFLRFKAKLRHPVQ